MTSTLEPGQSSNFKTLIYYDKTRQFQLRVTRKVWPLLLIPTVHGVSMLEPIGAKCQGLSKLTTPTPNRKSNGPPNWRMMILADDPREVLRVFPLLSQSTSFDWISKLERDAGLRLTTQTTQWIWMFALRTRKAPLQQGKSSVLFAWSIASLASPNNKQLSRLSPLASYRALISSRTRWQISYMSPQVRHKLPLEMGTRLNSNSLQNEASNISQATHPLCQPCRPKVVTFQLRQFSPAPRHPKATKPCATPLHRPQPVESAPPKRLHSRAWQANP